MRTKQEVTAFTYDQSSCYCENTDESAVFRCPEIITLVLIQADLKAPGPRWLNLRHKLV